MNDVSAHSHGEMTYWKAWFHFWVKSFPGGIHTKDYLNPTFYYTENKRKLRVFIHTVVIVIIALIIGTLLSPVTGVTNANAQYGGYTAYYNDQMQQHGNNGNNGGSSGGGNYNSGSTNIGSHNSGSPDPCVLVYEGMIADGYNSPIVYDNAYAAMAQCYAWQAQGDGGWWPDTSCEWTALASMGLGVAEVAIGAGGSIPSGGTSTALIWIGGAQVGVSWIGYTGCDGRW